MTDNRPPVEAHGPVKQDLRLRGLHKLEGDNVLVHATTGGRQCRACKLDTRRTRAAEKAAARQQYLDEHREEIAAQEAEAAEARHQYREQYRRMVTQTDWYRAARQAADHARDAEIREVIGKEYGRKCECCGCDENLGLCSLTDPGWRDKLPIRHTAGIFAYRYLVREFRKTGEWMPGLLMLCPQCRSGDIPCRHHQAPPPPPEGYERISSEVLAHYGTTCSACGSHDASPVPAIGRAWARTGRGNFYRWLFAEYHTHGAWPVTEVVVRCLRHATRAQGMDHGGEAGT